MSHYAILPKLPVPPLGGSLDRLLSALRPLLSPRDLAEAARATGTFSEGQGPYLQARLERLAQETDNWASHVWVQTRYSTNQSLLFTNAPVCLLSQFQLSDANQFMVLVSRYVSAALNRIQALRTGVYPQEEVGGVPLCMAQYRHVAGGHRLPGLVTDSYCQSPESRHIIVMHAGGVYKVPVYRTGGEGPVSVQEMYGLLSQVLGDPRGAGARSVGLLTALERDQWYSAREQLIESPLNREFLRAVETCLFGVCLDQSDAGTPTGILKQSRFGDPLYFNRWFGIACQAVFTRDGYLAWLIDHSMLDGSTVSLFCAPPDLSEPVEPGSDAGAGTGRAELLGWEISPRIETRLREARLLLAGWYRKYDIDTFRFSAYGKEFLRSRGVYFQGYVQLALQLAYQRLHQGSAATYQPVSLRGFRCGRLEQAHTLTAESVAFVRAMRAGASSDRERHTLMLAGIRRHREIATEAAHGNVYLKHLQALKLLADEEQLQIELFNSSAYRVFTEPALCTSYVPSVLPLLSTYSQLNYRGHYVTFRPTGELIDFSVTTILGPHGQTTSAQFTAALLDSLLELRELLVRVTPDSKSKL